MSDLIPTYPQKPLATFEAIGQAANQAAARVAFVDYRNRKAKNTRKRQKNDLTCFATFLTRVGLTAGDLETDPEAWRGVTFGLVEAFRAWLLQSGYAIATVNFRVSSIKVYAGLAHKVGTIPTDDYIRIKNIVGYSRKEQRRLDALRTDSGLETRTGAKKPEPVSISSEQARALKLQPNTPQGRRDALLMCLLLDHGLRCGEIAGLRIENFDLRTGLLTFYRQKVDRTQTHELTKATLAAAKAYFRNDLVLRTGELWRASLSKAAGTAWKAGELGNAGLSERAITKRVNQLGKAAGLVGLSAHDCRHYWATQAARNGTPMDRLQDAGGWSSPAMPARYIRAAAIANQGVLLGD